MVPSPPLELKARPVPGSKPAPSVPFPMAGVAMTFKVAMSVTAIILLPQTLNSFLFLTSMASPEGSFAGRERGAAE